jgi:hypothetical protein
MTDAFVTKIEEYNGLLLGPWRSPQQMLAAQEYDGHTSIHDDETAKALGFKGGTIEGPTHFSQFSPLGAHLWGQEWFETGCISAHYRAAVFVGEQVQASIAKPVAGARLTTITMAKADGTEVLVGTMSVGQESAGPTALEARLAGLSPLADPVILHDVAVGMKSPRIAVTMAYDQNMGAYYPFSLAEKLESITEPSDWYSNAAPSPSPWGKPIIPLEMVSVLFQYNTHEFEFPMRGPAVGLFADQEIRLLRGPLYVGQTYEIEREIVFIGGSKRTESLWIKTTAFDPGKDIPLATMLLNAATFKDSYANYTTEHHTLYGDV